jgi:hypothetical protein
MTALYNSPHQFEPLLPSDARQEALLSKAGDLVRAATALAGQRVPPELQVLLRSMNSYYTNRIEGQHTRPHEIEQALRKDFSANQELAAKRAEQGVKAGDNPRYTEYLRYAETLGLGVVAPDKLTVVKV